MQFNVAAPEQVLYMPTINVSDSTSHHEFAVSKQYGV